MFSLKELFGNQVVVSLDESWYKPWPNIDVRTDRSVKLEGKSEEDKRWCYEIVGKRGVIYPQTETEVCVATTARIAKKLIALFGTNCRIYRTCDEGIDLIIPIKLIRSTFRYIKPKQRRQLTDAQKAVLTQRLRGKRLP